jgi:PAS domain S-box-containing protein
LPASPRNQIFGFALGTVILVGLYFTSLESYLMFHVLAEMFSIVVAFGIFTIGWNSRNYIRNNSLVFLAIAYLFIAFLDLLHTMSYKGMGIFTSYDYYANQLWIATRYMESLALFVAFLFLGRRQRFNPTKVFAGFALTTALVVASVFWWKIFPVCFIEGQGLTPFKKISEYIICVILFVDILVLIRLRDQFSPEVHRWLILSLSFTIGSELCFTFYISNYGFSNLVGHYFKIFSFYYVYKALVETGITAPHDVFFKALHDSEEKFRALVESSTDFIWEVDRHGRYTYASPLARKLLGYEPDEMVGKPFFSFMLPEDARRAWGVFDEDDRKCPYLVNSEIVFIRKDGDHVVLERSGVPVLDEQGKVKGYRGVDRDVTERKRHELELRKLIRAVEGNPNAIVICDPHGTAEYANPAFTVMMGNGKGGIVGRDLGDLICGEGQEAFCEELRRAMDDGEFLQEDVEYVRDDGESLWVQVSLGPVMDEKGTVENFVITLADVSDRKNLERFKEGVEQITRHDLKTPLNGIISVPNLMLLEENLTDDQRMLLGVIEDTGRRMLRMIDSSLDLFKMETGTFEYSPEEVDVTEVLDLVLKELDIPCQSKHVDIAITVDGEGPGGPFVIQSERDLFISMLTNFITNAVEASPEGETVSVALESRPAKAIRITNRGAVPVEMRERFFQKYKTHGKKKGTGLGTYSAKLIGDAMGYDLQLDTSDADDATTITIVCG